MRKNLFYKRGISDGALHQLFIMLVTLFNSNLKNNNFYHTAHGLVDKVTETCETIQGKAN